ncbi:hypothetical protein PGIGA_G00174910 [Pangasianodon gigas]|uniref:Uncharacterized protein n=1 Tax=Pangasianodon gigas TaxID=30993 RepID=A0ACC5XUF6_PANGG|nr:hypothetical protein [Pangasianodon gigas]
MIASDSSSCLTGVEPNLVFCCRNPSTSSFNVLCMLRSFSARHSDYMRFYILPGSSNQSGHFPLTSQQGVSTHRTVAYSVFIVFSHHSV